MNKNLLPRSFRSYLPFIVCIAVLTVVIPRANVLSYDYEKGKPWKYDDLVSEFDFPVYKTAAQLQEEFADSKVSVIPFYDYAENVVIRNLNSIDDIDLGKHAYMASRIAISARKIYTCGIIPDDISTGSIERGILSDEVLYIVKDKHTAKYPSSEVYTQRSARAALLEDLSKSFPNVNADSVLRESGVYDFIEPDLLYDSKTTELSRRETVNTISPTEGYVKSGVTLIKRGEVVTSESEKMIDSYSREYALKIGGGRSIFMEWLTNFLIAVLLTSIFFLVLFFTSKGTFKRYKELDYVTFIFLLSSISIILMTRFEMENYVFLLPLPVFARYLEAFFKDKVILSVYIVSLLPLLLFDNYGAGLFLLFLLTGLVAVVLSQRLKRGLEQIFVVLAIFLVMSASYVSVVLYYDLGSPLWSSILMIFIGSFISIAFYPMVYVFERIFGLVSDSRLEELTDTGNTLLRDLEMKAPGTFQHSLQVMSMCTAVARAVNADEYLLRAAALYHDIGKMNNPLCFVENATASAEEGQGYHDELTPVQSAADIIRHVTDGLEIAQKSHLPRLIKEFIVSHHGTTVVRYFYTKFLNEGGDPSEMDCFKYQGETPKTKEQVILMLCDTIEAASRTLKGNTPKVYSDFVESIVASKMDEGQFNDADITLQELNVIKETLKIYLSQLYHERVVYPKRKKIN